MKAMDKEAKYRRIFENIQDVYFEADTNGFILEISPSAGKLLNYTRDELINKYMPDLYHRSNDKNDLFKIVKENGVLSDYELSMKDKDGNILVCSINARLLNDEFGSRIIGSIRDISRRKSMEKKLRESEELYRTLAEKSFAGVYVVKNGKFCFVNSNAASYAGYEKEELIGRDSLSLVHPDDKQGVIMNAKAMLKGERSAPYEFRIVTKDGQIQWIMESVAPIVYDGMPAVLGNSMNTSWTLSRVDLEIVQAIIESVHDGVYIADIDGNYITANAGFERISGINRNELIGRHTTYLMEKKWISEVVNLDVLKDYQSRSKIIRYPSQKDVLVSADMVWDKNKRAVGVVSSLRDLTELNNMQKQLMQSKVLIKKYKSRLDLLESKLNVGELKLIAQSTEGRRILSLAEKLSQSDVTVLISGESGVGKEVVARYIHENSKRNKEGTFVKIDCAALPANLLESELFGYERGSFTNANKEGKRGLFEVADKGTLFLDEIGEVPFELQSKLLNAIQDREIKRIGGLSSLAVDVRIIAATNRNLEEMVKEKKFRKDLYYRLKVIPVYIPPLRDRIEDIIPLVNYYLDYFNKMYKTKKYISNEGIKCLSEYDWPGNIRELKNSIERLVIMAPGDYIQVNDIKNEVKAEYPDGLSLKNELKSRKNIGPLKKLVQKFEKEVIDIALDIHGNLADAARDLEIDVSTLTRKRKK
ncbi:MAG: sigma 54-interacting transcriptional regulator [Syntrophales bacterium]